MAVKRLAQGCNCIILCGQDDYGVVSPTVTAATTKYINSHFNQATCMLLGGYYGPHYQRYSAKLPVYYPSRGIVRDSRC